MGQKELSLLLKIVVAVAAVFLLLVCALFVPLLGHEVIWYFEAETTGIVAEVARLLGSRTVGIGVEVFVWLTAVPGFIALFLAWKIFAEIGRNNSFCTENAKRLRLISRLALLDTVLYMALAVVMFSFGLIHPSVLLVLTAVILFGSAMTIAGAALSHLTQKAADMKADNDLTI